MTDLNKAMYAPLTRIVKNAGQNGSSVVEVRVRVLKLLYNTSKSMISNY